MLVSQECGRSDPDFEDLYQQAPCGYLVLDDEGVITTANDTFLGWAGYDRDAVVGTTFSRLLPVGDRILYSTHLAPRLRVGGTIAEALIEIVGAGGERRPALLSAARTAATLTRPARTGVIIFSAAERRRYEEELVTALRRATESDELRADAETGLKHLARHDPLTGLLNRLGLTERLDADLRAQAGVPVAVLLINLDHFKVVNDSLGRPAGDELLQVVAERLQAGIRDSGLVARLSADEYVVVDRLAAGQLEALGARILDRLSAPVLIEGLEVVVSAGIGAAVAELELDTSEALLHRAEMAMHRAKAGGSGRLELYDPARGAPEVHRLQLLGELRAAIATDQLRLHYQPRVELRSGRFRGVEALVRWQHPTRGLLPPSEFLPVAEDSGLIRDLGAWVLREAVAELARWNRAGVADGRAEMAVNLSTRQLSEPKLVELVRDTLARNQIEPEQLTLEITETALMDGSGTALSILEQLHALGVKIAIDDFGTGYGSLTYLQQFPIDELKIDRSFVTALGSGDDDGAAIVAACVQLAHAVGIHALAEGVETTAQRQRLVALGCDLAQGYLFSRPIGATELMAWLADWGAGQRCP